MDFASQIPVVALTSPALITIVVIVLLRRRLKTVRSRQQGILVVSDTSVITNLANINYLWVLQKIYGRVVVPPMVWREMRRFAPRNRGVWKVRRALWIRRARVQYSTNVEQLIQATGLHRGEAEAIILSEELHALLLIDEARGRTVANRRHVPTIGLLGVLLQAKHYGHIERVRPLMDRLINDSGFHISRALYVEVCRQAGE